MEEPPEICPRCGYRDVEIGLDGFCAPRLVERMRESYGAKQRAASMGRRVAWAERSSQTWDRDRKRVSRLRRTIKPKEPARIEDPWVLADAALQELNNLRTVNMRAEQFARLEMIAETIRRLAYGPDDKGIR